MNDARKHLDVVESNGGCGCEEHDGQAPEFDVRQIPYRLRHGAVFGALSAVGPGQAMVLVAPHDPKPLLAQIAEREDGVISVTYLQRGPDAWRLRLHRDAALG